MRRSKRNIGSVYGSLGDRFEQSKVRVPAQPILKSITKRSNSGLEKDSLISAIFSLSDSYLLVVDTGNTFHRISKRNFKIMEFSFMFEKLNYLAGSFSKMNRAL